MFLLAITSASPALAGEADGYQHIQPGLCGSAPAQIQSLTLNHSSLSSPKPSNLLPIPCLDSLLQLPEVGEGECGPAGLEGLARTGGAGHTGSVPLPDLESRLVRRRRSLKVAPSPQCRLS